ncbi:hypothetical protein [Saezia sanguinis]|uniref:hypothetical protein n=1 Tax=Saezia sanguinis TaxID=1965230 RepID=UPI00305631F2
MTLDDFADEIGLLENNLQSRDLKTYLLALYKILTDGKEQYVRQQASRQLVLEVLKQAITSEPACFNDAWLDLAESPDVEQISASGSDPVAGMAYSLAVLKFQIAELHKMQGKQLQNEDRYYGIESETGNWWYNFDPFSNLSCGIECMSDWEEEEEGTEKDTGWFFIGRLLELGRMYE